MGIFDKIKDAASDAADKGQAVAREQQLKFELRKLDGAIEEAYTAYGRRAFELHEAGTLAAGELATEATAVREAIAARDAKKAELDGASEPDEASASEPAVASAADPAVEA